MFWQWIKELLSAWLTGLNSKVISKNSETVTVPATVSEPAPQIKPAPELRPVSPRLLGIDVSHHNGVLDWEKLAQAGVKFVFAKATESTGFVDGQFPSNITRARKAGVLAGAYHFLRTNCSGRDQAAHFLNVIEKVTCDLPPVLDWEIRGSESVSKQIQIALDWLERIERETGRTPIIYTGPSFATELGIPKGFERYRLWIAHYETKEPRVPLPWKDWHFWQYTETGALPGIPKQFDLNLFKGDLKALRDL